MTWTFTNLVIQIIAGILGGHAAAAASKEHGFGALGHTIVGAVGGGLSGAFFQTRCGRPSRRAQERAPQDQVDR
jgi:uncharacterized membrane protein YeaQ/YmgE (transglycosylase-associated protein family)